MILFFIYIAIWLLPCAFGSDGRAKNFTFIEYIRFISDLHDFFATTSVFVVSSGNCGNPSELQFMSIMSKEFSRKFVLSQNANLSTLHQEVFYYKDKTLQSLFVIILKSQSDIDQFSAMTKRINMGFRKWLLIFHESNDEKFKDYCKNPYGNHFNLVVTTKMIVKCPDSWKLWEWYSIDRLNVLAPVYGYWSHKQGLKKEILKTFHERRSDFKGHHLRVSIIKSSLHLLTDNMYTGEFFSNVLFELSRKMNFTIKIVSVQDSYGIFNKSIQKWTGVIGKVAAKEVDIGVGEFTMNTKRAAVVDYTIPLMLTFSDIYIKRPNMTTVNWSVYTKAFHTNIWLLIFANIMIVPLLLSMESIKYDEFKITHDYLSEKFLHVWGIFCQKSLPDFPITTAMRIAYISIFTSSLVLFGVYSAYLTSYLTVFTPVVPFRSYQDFIADGTYKLIVLRNSVNHELFSNKKNSLLSAMGKFLKNDEDLPNDICSAINQVCNEKVVLFTNQLFIEKISEHSPCDLMPLTQGSLDNLGLILTKNSPYTEIFNYNLKTMRAYGIVERLKRLYFKKFNYKDSNYFPVSLDGIMPVVGILGLGCIASFLILFCECYYYRWKERKVLKRSKEKNQLNVIDKASSLL